MQVIKFSSLQDLVFIVFVSLKADMHRVQKLHLKNSTFGYNAAHTCRHNLIAPRHRCAHRLHRCAFEHSIPMAIQITFFQLKQTTNLFFFSEKNKLLDPECDFQHGICQEETEKCLGRFIAGLCKGPATRKCCVENPEDPFELKTLSPREQGLKLVDGEALDKRWQGKRSFLSFSHLF